MSIAIFAPFDLAAALVDQTLGWGDSSASQLLLVALLTAVAATFATGAVITLGAAEGSGSSTWFGAVQEAFRRLPTLLLLTLVSCVAISVGLLLLVIPGLVLLTWWFVSYPAAMIEERSALESLRRSRSLVSGAFWPTFLVAVSSVVLYGAVAFGGWRTATAVSDTAVGAGVGGAVGDGLGTVALGRPHDRLARSASRSIRV